LVIKNLPSDSLYTKENNRLLTAIKRLPGVEQVTLSDTDLTNDAIVGCRFTWPNGEYADSF